MNQASTEEEALEKVVSHFAPDMRTPRGDSWFFTCKRHDDKLKPLPKHYNTVQIKHHFRKYTEQEKWDQLRDYERMVAKAEAYKNTKNNF